MAFAFGPFTLDTTTFRLERNGVAVACEPQVFALLRYLVEHNDRLVSKDEIIAQIWQGRAISEGALNSCLTAARRAVDDNGKAQDIIRTLPRRGFQFIAPVTELPGPKSETGVAPALTPSIAVLPFRNLSDDTEQGFFAEGMLEDLVMTLSRIRWLVVVSSGTTRTYHGQAPDPSDIAADLDVRYVLRGSVRRAGPKLRITAQLADCRHGVSIWAQKYDREVQDIFFVQDDITVQVAAAVEHELGRVEQAKANRTRPENLDAWLTYQQAMSKIRNDAATGQRKELAALFDRAIALDPRFSLAHAGRAFSEYWGYIEGLGSLDFDTAFHHANTAIELDPLEPFAHQALGSVFWAQGSIQSSLDASSRAIELNPSFAWSHHLLSITNLSLGRTKAARKNVETAIRLSPRDTLIGIFYGALSLCCLCEADYLGCVHWGRRSMAYPQPRWVHAYVLSALGHLSDMEEAREIRTLISRVRPEFSIAYIEARFPVLRGDARARFLDGLHRAGLRAN